MRNRKNNKCKTILTIIVILIIGFTIFHIGSNKSPVFYKSITSMITGDECMPEASTREGETTEIDMSKYVKTEDSELKEIAKDIKVFYHPKSKEDKTKKDSIMDYGVNGDGSMYMYFEDNTSKNVTIKYSKTYY